MDGERLNRAVAAFCVAFIVLGMFASEAPYWDTWKTAFRDRTVINLSASNPTATRLDPYGEHPLGTYPYRPHFHVTKSCSKVHSFSTKRELICEGLNYTNSDGRVFCGGLELKPGLCMVAESAEYIFRKEISFGRKLRETCNLQVTWFDFRLGRFSSNERYYGPHCALADINPRWLHDHFNGKVIAFVGDSHTRNLFTSFVAEVRNQRFIGERHPDTETKDTLYPYQVFEIGSEKDRFLDKIGSRELTAKVLTASCKGSGFCSVVAVFLWAGFPEEYEALLNGALRTIAPDLIVSDFVSKAYTQAAGFEASLERTAVAFEGLFRAQTKPTAFVLSPFPLFGGSDVLAYVRKWRQDKFLSSDSKFAHVKMLIVDQAELVEAYVRTGKRLEQLRFTSHTVCGIYDTYSLAKEKKDSLEGGHKVIGMEACVAPIDRAVVRAALTFANQAL